MSAVSRAIEKRVAGRRGALSVDVRVFIEDEMDKRLDVRRCRLRRRRGDRFLLSDGDGSDQFKRGLVAEERDPNQLYGFWTYDPETVDEIIDYLRTTYDSQ